MARILIVDDHIETCRVMSLLVKHLGHTAHAINGGHDAVDFLTNNKVDLIILDIMMPGISGMDVLRKLRHNPSTLKTPVIMMTAITDPLTRHEAIQAGANDYWVKATIDVTELERRINYHVGSGEGGEGSPVHHIANVPPVSTFVEERVRIEPIIVPTAQQTHLARFRSTWPVAIEAAGRMLRQAASRGLFVYSPSTSATV